MKKIIRTIYFPCFMFPKFKNKFFLAPMLGVTDTAFRMLCRRYGASLCYSEMVAANALKHMWPQDLMIGSPLDRPLAIQLIGADASEMAHAAQMIEDRCDIIDINCGCPSRTTVASGAGSALLCSPDKIAEIVKKCSETVDIPVTVKIRSGFSDVNAVEIARICEENGAAAITVHGRTQKQGYRLKSDLEIIKEVKNAMSIPVIGNGDVRKPEDAFSMLDKTGCDYVMIGRGAMIDPMLFERILEYQKNGSYGTSDKISLIHEYLEFASEFKTPFPQIKCNVQNLSSGVKGGSAFRLKINSVKNVDEIIKELTLLEKIHSQ
jgi:nifR3 family TIM-barrel protein